MKSNIRNVSFDDHANIIGITCPLGFQIVDGSSGAALSVCNLPQFPAGCNLISTLGTSNILAITPLEEESKSVYVWDRNNNCQMLKIDYNQPVVAVTLKPEYIIAATTKNVQVRNLSNSSLLRKFDTTFNRDGIFDTPSAFSSNIIAFPATDIGVVTIVDIDDSSSTPKHVHAFKSSILSIKFSSNGRLLAICGDGGRTVNVYNYPSLKLIAHLKRGTTSTRINSMTFDEHGTRLAVSDNSETIHVFDLHQEPEDGFIKPIYKLKSPDSQPIWINFSTKTLKLGGVTANGNIYRIMFNQEDKSASFEQVQTKLKLK